jgi:hypothetical protein
VVRIHSGVPNLFRKISALAGIRKDRTPERPLAKGRFFDDSDQQLTSAGMRPLVTSACAQPAVSGRGWKTEAEAGDIGAQINSVHASLLPQGGVIRVNHSDTFATPICFCTFGKLVLLVGASRSGPATDSEKLTERAGATGGS